MRAWKDLGVVETIYEEEYEDSSTCPSLSPSISPPSTPLHSKVEAWTLATGQKTDVLVNVQGSCFRLHKDPLTLRSDYLKRHLTEVSVITLSPPLNITAETFTLVADFCYGTHPVITPFNVAALRTAAELLEMTEIDDNGDENLRQVTEAYFRQAVAVNREYASIVFRSCLPLLPEAETTACLVSRCIEALSLTDDGDGVVSGVDDFKTVCIEDFEIVADSMHRRFTRSHDLIYRIVDFYLKDHNGKVTEDQKIQICNSIDCTKLSPPLLMHAVQNPRMPLRFVVRAMFIEQLNTRRSIISATDHHHHHHHRHSRNRPNRDAITLGAILQRDAALRQVAQLKAAMDATGSRIKSLEKDLSGMKKILHASEKQRNLLESGRSASFRLSSSNKVERGERGTTSSVSLRFRDREKAAGGSSSEEGSWNDSPRIQKNIGWRLMNRLKSAFRVSNSSSKHGSESRISDRKDGDGDGDVIVIEDDQPSHRRSRSLV
ncbi:hypothetical protein L1049_023416 [Liquidambar formosana]|uniref:BTB/POZ domain-containing protein n=1 Tax=Liquidambar formosana TaxID=63359 RepID=A0AAP0RTG0_LIQFO